MLDKKPEDSVQRSPRPKRELPKQPKNFPKIAGAIWDELAPKLFDAGLLTDVDGTAFALLCRDMADIERVEAKLNEIDDWVDTTPNGYRVQSVWLNIRNRLHSDILGLCKEFGMTPASRSTLKTVSAPATQGELFGGADTQSGSRTYDPYQNFGSRPN